MHRLVLALSALVQLVAGAAFLLAPQRMLAWGGLDWDDRLESLTINLGCLVMLCGFVSAVAYRWSGRQSPSEVRSGAVLGVAVGVMLLAMAALQLSVGVHAPVVFDGTRGAVLVVTGAMVLRLHAAETPDTILLRAAWQERKPST